MNGNPESDTLPRRQRNGLTSNGAYTIVIRASDMPYTSALQYHTRQLRSNERQPLIGISANHNTIEMRIWIQLRQYFSPALGKS